MEKIKGAERMPQKLSGLLREFRTKQNQLSGELGKLLRFERVEDKTVYNITAPFKIENDDRWFLAGRVESGMSRWREPKLYDSRVMIFAETGGVWVPETGTLVIEGAEDPSIAFVNHEIVLGVIKVVPGKRAADRHYKPLFWRGKDAYSLYPFAEGPRNMKDIRMCQYNDRIAVFTRPEFKKGQKYVKKIGFTVLDSLKELTPGNLEKATILEHIFDIDEWGGVNAAYPLSDGMIGVVGHIAAKSGKEKIYCAVAFLLNPKNMETTPLKIIAERRNFQKFVPKCKLSPAKNNVSNVVFPGGFPIEKRGIFYKKPGVLELYAGLSDVVSGCRETKNPFI